MRPSAARRRAEERKRRRGQPEPKPRPWARHHLWVWGGLLLFGAAVLLPRHLQDVSEPIGEIAEAPSDSGDPEPAPVPPDEQEWDDKQADVRSVDRDSPHPEIPEMPISSEVLDAEAAKLAAPVPIPDPLALDETQPDPEIPEVPISSEVLDAESAKLAMPVPNPNPLTLNENEPTTVARGDEARREAAAPPPVIASPEIPVGRFHVVHDEQAPPTPDDDPPSSAQADQARPTQIARTETAEPPEELLWVSNAVPVSHENRPMVALVFDDLGLNRPNTRRVIALPAPMTLSFMTYARGLETFARSAREAGHELMVHIPMEPSDESLDPGQNVLLTGMEPMEIRRRLLWGLERFSGYVGVNNHMGSRFTSYTAGMREVLSELRSRGLLFLDSKTAVVSVGADLARELGVAYAERDVFIDNDPGDKDSIRRQLARLENIARRNGAAVGIGHPHSSTIEVVADWAREAQERGVALVPISAIVRRTIRLAEQAGSQGSGDGATEASTPQ